MGVRRQRPHKRVHFRQANITTYWSQNTSSGLRETSLTKSRSNLWISSWSFISEWLLSSAVFGWTVDPNTMVLWFGTTHSLNQSSTTGSSLSFMFSFSRIYRVSRKNISIFPIKVKAMITGVSTGSTAVCMETVNYSRIFKSLISLSVFLLHVSLSIAFPQNYHMNNALLKCRHSLWINSSFHALETCNLTCCNSPY